MVKKIEQLFLVILPIKRAWSLSGVLQWVDNNYLAHITSYPWGQVTLKQFF